MNKKSVKITKGRGGIQNQKQHNNQTLTSVSMVELSNHHTTARSSLNIDIHIQARQCWKGVMKRQFKEGRLTIPPISTK